MRSCCAAPERAARRYAAPPLKLWRSSSLQKVFVVHGTLCRPVLCKGRRQVPPPPEAGGPLHSTARPAVAHSGTLLGIGTMAVHSSVVALLAPATRYGRLPADVLAGARRVLLARARPSSAVRSVTPLATQASRSPLSAVGLARLMRIRAPLSIGQRQAHTRTSWTHTHGPLRPRSAPTHHAGKGSRRRSSDLLAALASNPLGCPKASGGRRNARTGLPLSFLRWQASCAPRRPGQ